jgi:hypothetical protein
MRILTLFKDTLETNTSRRTLLATKSHASNNKQQMAVLNAATVVARLVLVVAVVTGLINSYFSATGTAAAAGGLTAGQIDECKRRYNTTRILAEKPKPIDCFGEGESVGGWVWLRWLLCWGSP